MLKYKRGITVEVLKIAVCDDERRDIDAFKRLIKQSGVVSRVFEYTSAEELLSAFAPGIFHLILLDIYLDGKNASAMSGLEAAERIRETDLECWIAFTTISRDHVHFGYKVKADRYLEKPLDEREVISLIQRAKSYFEGREKEIVLTVDRKPRSVKLNGVLYVEKYGRKCIFHLVDEAFDAYATMDELMAMLPMPPFLRCHRSFIVNMDYVVNDKDKEDFVMVGGARVPISRDRKWKTLEKYRAYKAMLARGERW